MSNHILNLKKSYTIKIDLGNPFVCYSSKLIFV